MGQIINIVSGFLAIGVFVYVSFLFLCMIFSDIRSLWRATTAERQAKRWENIKYIAGTTADGYEKQNR